MQPRETPPDTLLETLFALGCERRGEWLEVEDTRCAIDICGVKLVVRQRRANIQLQFPTSTKLSLAPLSGPAGFLVGSGCLFLLTRVCTALPGVLWPRLWHRQPPSDLPPSLQLCQSQLHLYQISAPCHLSLHLEPKSVILVPIDNTMRSDTAVLKMIAAFLATS